MSYVTRRVMLCPKCKGEMKIITSLKELGYVPFDWYELGDKVLDNHNIHICTKCKILVVEKTDTFSKILGWFRS
jgi:hypothetical protein